MVYDRFAYPPAPGGGASSQIDLAFLELQQSVVPMLLTAVPAACRVCLTGGTSRFTPMIALATADALYIDGHTHWGVAKFRLDLESTSPQMLLDTLRWDMLPPKMSRIIEHLIELPATKGWQRRGPAFELLTELLLRQQIDHQWQQDYPDEPLVRLGTEVVVFSRRPTAAPPKLLQLMWHLQGSPLQYEQLALASVDVDDEPVIFGGFSLSGAVEEMKISLTDHWWSDLSRRLAPLSAVSNERVINNTIVSWVRAVSPTFGWSDPIVLFKCVKEVAEGQRVSAMPHFSRFAEWVYNARMQWARVRRTFVPEDI